MLLTLRHKRPPAIDQRGHELPDCWREESALEEESIR